MFFQPKKLKAGFFFLPFSPILYWYRSNKICFLQYLFDLVSHKKFDHVYEDYIKTKTLINYLKSNIYIDYDRF